MKKKKRKENVATEINSKLNIKSFPEKKNKRKKEKRKIETGNKMKMENT